MIELFPDVYYRSGHYLTKSAALSQSLVKFMKLATTREKLSLDDEDDFAFAWYDMQVNIPAIRGISPADVRKIIETKIQKQ